MRILGIETSCDETAAAVVDDGRIIRSNVVASQIAEHERFGGVVPEIASRQHILAIEGVTRRALDEAGCSLMQIDLVAVTVGPGLAGPLLVGINFAKGLAMALGLPLVLVNHIEGHVMSVWLVNQPWSRNNQDGSRPCTTVAGAVSPPLPHVSLVASGGHTELILVTKPGTFRVLGTTVDDAAGEAFDKVGRLLGLPYPGGPALESVAAAVDPIDDLVLPRAWLPGTLDFSFSGLKTAAVRLVREERGDDGPVLEVSRVAAIARAFQTSVADVLSRKLAEAVIQFEARSAAIVGGVANNEYIRHMAEGRVSVPLLFPGPGLSSDNAAMIAGAAYWNRTLGAYDADARPSLGIKQDVDPES